MALTALKPVASLGDALQVLTYIEYMPELGVRVELVERLAQFARTRGDLKVARSVREILLPDGMIDHERRSELLAQLGGLEWGPSPDQPRDVTQPLFRAGPVRVFVGEEVDLAVPSFRLGQLHGVHLASNERGISDRFYPVVRGAGGVFAGVGSVPSMCGAGF